MLGKIHPRYTVIPPIELAWKLVIQSELCDPLPFWTPGIW